MTETSAFDIPKPRPIPTPTSQRFWEGLARDQVLLQQCAECDSWIFYPRSRCTHCMSDSLQWREVTGRGTLFTYCIATQPTAAMFADETPQVIGIVELNEGVRLTTTLITDDAALLEVGSSVEPVFDHGADGMTLLRFRIIR